MMKVKWLLPFAFGLLFPSVVHAQETGYFDHMDLGFSVGTTGLGMDVAMPVGNMLRVRTGFTYMPHFRIDSRFGVETGDGSKLSSQTIGKITDTMSKLTHMSIDDHVQMTMEPTFSQFKLLVDIMPFKHNKHWNLTLGFYAGPAKVGRTYNKTEDAATLLGVTMYNYFYINSCKQDPMFGENVSFGSMTLPAGQLPPEYLEKGMMGMPLGYFKDGDKAMLVPDENGMVKARMQVNSFRPYVGLGYSTPLSSDNKWKLSVDAGVLFWGGKPDVYVDNVYKIDTKSINPDDWQYDIVRHIEGTEDFIVDAPLHHISMTRDLHGVKGKVKDMVDATSRFKVLPNLGISLSYRLF